MPAVCVKCSQIMRKFPEGIPKRLTYIRINEETIYLAHPYKCMSCGSEILQIVPETFWPSTVEYEKLVKRIEQNKITLIKVKSKG